MTIALFLIDGMRPDALQQAATPIIDQLLASGAHTLSARTVMPSVTLPCITSLFLGVPPARHGITTNIWTPLARPVPGLMDVIQQSGKKAAAFYNWEPLRDLSQPGSLSASFFLKNNHAPEGDGELAELAARWLSSNRIDFVFVYLGYVDTMGHDHGWMSPPYLSAIANADRCIGKVRDILPSDATIIVMSDHGGHAQSHGTDGDEDLTIPFIISGSRIPRAHPIRQAIQITDVAPTVAKLLGLQLPAAWIGKPIEEIFPIV
ncbi:MAG: alkaline phosphatase family protein [Chloroflexota bacterium]